MRNFNKELNRFFYSAAAPDMEEAQEVMEENE